MSNTMRKIIIASNNSHKILEIKEILKELPVEVKSLRDEEIGIEIEEDGKTFKENANKKARGIATFLKERGDEEYIVLADDSGLQVDYLNGEPGIYSARYAGEHGNDKKNNAKLLKKLDNVPDEKRGASFVCEIALVDSKGNYYSIRGDVRGLITKEMEREESFGYDPIFYYPPLKKNFSQLSMEEKNEVSHRGKALMQLKDIILNII